MHGIDIQIVSLSSTKRALGLTGLPLVGTPKFKFESLEIGLHQPSFLLASLSI
jgi:hypothetical protein